MYMSLCVECLEGELLKDLEGRAPGPQCSPPAIRGTTLQTLQVRVFEAYVRGQQQKYNTMFIIHFFMRALHCNANNDTMT